MKFEEVNNKQTDSIILSLEQLTTEYENTLNMYNQVQQDLNTFANSEWQLNPYLNRNIQFNTGEIAYVSSSGGVYLYSFLPGLYSAISSDQSYVAQAQSVVNQDQNIVNQDQTAFNNSIGGQLQTGWNDFTSLFDGFTTMREGMSSGTSDAITVSNDLGGGGTYAVESVLDGLSLAYGGDSSQVSNMNAGIGSATSYVNSAVNANLAGLTSGTVSGVQNAFLTDVLGGDTQLASQANNTLLSVENTVGNAISSAANTVSSGENNFFSGNYDNQIDTGLATAQSDIFSGVFGNSFGGALNSAATTVENGIGTLLSGGYDSTINNALNTEFNVNAGSNLQTAQANLSNAQATLSTQENNLNSAEANLQNALGQLTQSGCPSTTSNVTQINLPWYPEYNALYALIPTTPPLITMGQLTYNSGNIGFTSFNGTGNGPINGGCNGINVGLTSPPYDIINIPNQSYNANSLGTFQDMNESTCSALCSAWPSCSGANFNTYEQNCTLMSGAGVLKPTLNSVALIPKITQYILVLSQLNFKLTQVNDQIIDRIKTGEGEFIKYNNDTAVDNKLLQNRYKILVAERERIDQMIDNIGHTQEEENYEQTITSSSYLKYGLLLTLVVIVFIILANINRSTEHMNSDGTVQNSIFFIIFVVAFIVIGVLILKNYVTGTPNF